MYWIIYIRQGKIFLVNYLDCITKEVFSEKHFARRGAFVANLFGTSLRIEYIMEGMMKTGRTILKLIGRLIKLGALLVIGASLLFISYMGNQPMKIQEAPAGMTYFDFMTDRMDAAQTVEPSRCGWGTMLTLAALGPIYSIVYTEAGIHPEGEIAKHIARDPAIPQDVSDSSWKEVPFVWWHTVEQLSWTLLGQPNSSGCQFRPVEFPQE